MSGDRTRGGYPCRNAHRGCTYAAVVPSLTAQHEQTCDMRDEETR